MNLRPELIIAEAETIVHPFLRNGGYWTHLVKKFLKVLPNCMIAIYGALGLANTRSAPKRATDLCEGRMENCANLNTSHQLQDISCDKMRCLAK